MLSHLQFLLISAPSLTTMFTFFIFNLIISGVIAFILTYVVSPQIDQNKKKLCWCLLTVAATFVPLFGIFIALWIVSFFRHYYYKASKLEIRSFSHLDMPNDKNPAAAVYAPGWAEVRLRTHQFSKKARMQALRIINKNVDHAVNKLNWMLLLDDVEELRLYAFSLLEKQRDHFNKNIYRLMKEQQAAPSAERAAPIEKQLAFQYREIIALNLIEPELRELVLQKCYFYADKAVKVLTQDAGLWCLLAHYHFENGQTQPALEALTMAQQLKAPNSWTLPFFSENSFKNRDYVKVKTYLSADNSFREIPNLGKIVDFWCIP